MKRKRYSVEQIIAAVKRMSVDLQLKLTRGLRLKLTHPSTPDYGAVFPFLPVLFPSC